MYDSVFRKKQKATEPTYKYTRHQYFIFTTLFLLLRCFKKNEANACT